MDSLAGHPRQEQQQVTPAVWAAIVTAGVAVVSSIGSVLLLAYNVGKLTGIHDARLKAGEDDSKSIWKSLGILTGRFDRHIEHHPAARGGR